MTLLYPGSFDPVTLGHIDIAVRGAKICNRLIVAVLDNPSKTGLFPVQARIEFLQDALGSINNIEVSSFSGLLAEYARQMSVTAILRGVRTSGDLESETRYATANRLISDGVETVFLPSTPLLSHISSSIVREAAQHIYAGNLSDFALCNMVTPQVQDALRKKYSVKSTNNKN